MSTPMEEASIDITQQVAKKLKRPAGSKPQLLTYEVNAPARESQTLPEFRVKKGVVLAVDPEYFRHLVEIKVLGFQRPLGSKPQLLTYEVNAEELRRCFNGCMFAGLRVRLFSNAAYETQTESAILALATEIAKFTTDVCMAALYAKLHSIHKSLGRYESRYASDPCYTEDVPLPLPFGMAVQDFGVFETLRHTAW
ncbi:unnamed protein product [Cuscuta europaea]|uniref:Uncharacterized protein n=1 Tax=Cuscuta europaea TaxID=41803 RepID=A0A9P0Z6I6_CUSEU|nr:unnamed protein product [Cuscuta europaea]